MKKFHHLFGKRFHSKTEQKPLENFLAKSLTQAKQRPQCLLISSLSYNFSVKYIKMSNKQLADCLLRLGPLDDEIKLPIV